MIKITTGPVKAGKSKKLIETYNELIAQGIKVQVFSSKYSLTSGEGIVSRYGTEIKAIPISSLYVSISFLDFPALTGPVVILII